MAMHSRAALLDHIHRDSQMVFDRTRDAISRAVGRNAISYATMKVMKVTRRAHALFACLLFLKRRVEKYEPA